LEIDSSTGVLRSDLRGGIRIAVDATTGAVDLVEAMHLAIARLCDPFHLTRGIAKLVYGSIRAITTIAGTGIDVAARAIPLPETEGSSPRREWALALLNGVFGDYLSETANPLAITMRFRQGGKPFPLDTESLAERFPDARRRILILVHGLCLSDLDWRRQGHDRAAKLAVSLGYTPVHLHYNSGLRVSANGRRFSELVETLIDQWPVPVEEIVILGHSMGGLIARSACHYGRLADCRWPIHVSRLVFLGTPHHGTLLERAGSWVDATLETNPFSAPLARVGKLRSAGITDLRFGSTCDSDCRGCPLPEHAQCYTVAAVAGAGDSLYDRLLGDGLVPLRSALGAHEDKALALNFPRSNLWVCRGASHFDLLSRDEVYERLNDWLAGQS
jgi:pimeloyl-ACP methyl ester carboxylesterase